MMNLERVLVIGLRESDAGKTTLARGLIDFMQQKGVDVCGFKPRAANSIWYDYQVVYEALSQGRLYGKDAKLLKKASGTSLSEEVISPVHRLWAVAPQSIRTELSEVPHFIVDRITLFDDQTRDIAILNDTLPFEYGREELVENLFEKVTSVYHVSDLEELKRISNYGHYEAAIRSAYRRITREHGAVVFESYSDIALPWQGIENLDIVLAVEPGYIYIYDPDKYLSAAELSTNIRNELKAEGVCRLLKPMKTVRVPPFRPGQMVNRLQDKIASKLI